MSHQALRRTALQWSREAQILNYEADYAHAANVSLDVADKNFTTRTHRRWADVLYQNIAKEVSRQGLGTLLGLDCSPSAEEPLLPEVYAALGLGDVEEAARLLQFSRQKCASFG